MSATLYPPFGGDKPKRVPAAPVSPTGCTEPTEPTEPTELTELTELTENPEITEMTERIEPIESSEQKRITEATQLPEPSEPHVDMSNVRIQSIEGAIAFAIGSSAIPGKDAVFDLARCIKTLERTAKAAFSIADLKAVFDGWYEQAACNLPESHDRDELYFDFLEAHHRAKYGIDQDPLGLAWREMLKNTKPLVAMQFKNPQIQMLVGLCCCLQKASGSEPFYLSCRSVARLFNHKSHTKANLWLRGLCRIKIIKEVAKGSAETGRATRYRYLYPLDE